MTQEIMTPAEPWATLPPGEYAIVELFGHTTLVGLAFEVERFGAKMLAIRPLFNGALLDEILHGGSAIYRYTRCSPKIAWEKQPTSDYQLPAAVRAIVPPTMIEAAPASSIDASASIAECESVDLCEAAPATSAAITECLTCESFDLCEQAGRCLAQDSA